MHKLAVCLLLFLVTSCSRQLRGPVVPRIISNPIYSEAQFALDLRSYRETPTSRAQRKAFAIA